MGCSDTTFPSLSLLPLFVVECSSVGGYRKLEKVVEKSKLEEGTPELEQ